MRTKTKSTQQLNLSNDVREMLHKQAENKGLSISGYVERLILKAEWDLEHESTKQKLDK